MVPPLNPPVLITNAIRGPATLPPTQPVAAKPPTESRPPQRYVTFKANPGSEVRIDGDSTAHEWYMVGSMIGGSFMFPEDMKFDSAAHTLASAGQSTLDAECQAVINVRSIHSEVKVGSSIMDGLYQDALKEKLFPKIVYSLVKMEPIANPASPVFQFNTEGDLAIAGVTNRIAMQVTMELTDDKQLRIKGSTPLKMTDFGITPPAPNIGIGVMRCKDDIKVSFVWVISAPTERPAGVFSNLLAGSTYVLHPNPSSLRNFAYGRIPTSSDTNARPETLERITDGSKSHYSQDIVLLRKGLQWVQIDLGSPCEIYSIGLWHAYEVAKVYHKVVVQCSSDPNFIVGVKTLFNNDSDNTCGCGLGSDSEYWETPEGKQISVRGILAQYVRFYSKGSTDSAMNEYTEIEVWGAANESQQATNGPQRVTNYGQGRVPAN